MSRNSLVELSNPIRNALAENNAAVDIVAVHGLNGDYIETWTDPQSKILWLEKLLPTSIRVARVLSYGYNAKISVFCGSSSADRLQYQAQTLVAALQADRSLEDCTHRPIIFICHDLGGILVKKALAYSAICTSQHVEHLYSIYASTFGILFFGTPHHGTNKSRLRAAHPQHRFRLSEGFSSESEILSVLDKESETLQMINEQFSPLMKQFHIFFFWEELPTGSGKSSAFIVEESSAAPTIDNTERSGIWADHFGMVRFSDLYSSSYRTVIEALGRYCRLAPQVIARRWEFVETRLTQTRSHEVEELLGVTFDVHNAQEPFTIQKHTDLKPRNRHFYIPQVVSSIFTGREDMSELVRRNLFEDEGRNCSWQQRRVVIYGIAGSGKTQFCSKFAQDYREKFWGVFCIDASSTGTIKSSFAAIGKLGSLEATESAGKHWLSHLDEPWLLIINNADDPDLDLQKLFPEGDRGLVLVTTRNPNFAVHATAGSVEFEGMKEEEALLLFFRAAGVSQPCDMEVERTGRKIAEALGHLALALIQAGATILQRVCDMKDYLSFYAECRGKVGASSEESSHRAESQIAVYSTWELSRSSIALRNTNASHDALQLLDVVAFFHFENIRVDIFTKALANRVNTLKQNGNRTVFSRIAEVVTNRLQSPPALPDFLRQDVSQADPYRIRRALQELISFRLVYYDGKHASFSLHPLVHTWTRDRLSKGQQNLWAQVALTALGESIEWPPSNAGTSEQNFLRDLLPHLDSCLKVAPVQQFRYRDRFGGCNLISTLLFQAPQLYSFKAEVFLAAKVGYVFSERGRFAESADILLKVKDALVESLGHENEKTIKATTALGQIYWGLDRLDEAVSLQTQVMESQRKVYGGDHRQTLLAMNYLGRSYWLNGQYHEALRLQKETVQKMKITLGDTDSDTLAAMDNYGVILGAWQEYEESRKVHEHVFNSRLRQLGPDHLDTLETTNNLAMVLLDLGKAVAAQGMMQRVYEQRCIQLGKEHPWTLWALCNLSRIYTELDLLSEAEDILVPGIEAAKRSLGEGHLGVLMGLGRLAQIYARQHRYEEAETLSTEILSQFELHRGVAHPDTVYCLWRKARLAHARGLSSKAIETAEIALERVDMRLTREHPLGRKISMLLDTLKARSCQEQVVTVDGARHVG